MKKQETTLSFLQQFLPPGTFDQIAPFFKKHTIHLTITHERKSVLGDYRNPVKDAPYHRISINANLNPYSFLITLLHELAHLLTFDQYKHTVAPHGKEWKEQFRRALIPFVGKGIFPPDVERALQAYLSNPAASTCTDPNLFKALYKYDEHKPGHVLVGDLAVGHLFATEDGRVFEKVEQMRTRSKGRDIKTGKVYLFQGIYEVKAVQRKSA